LVGAVSGPVGALPIITPGFLLELDHPKSFCQRLAYELTRMVWVSFVAQLDIIGQVPRRQGSKKTPTIYKSGQVRLPLSQHTVNSQKACLSAALQNDVLSFWYGKVEKSFV
jgi:hypothetical protein